MFEKGQQTYAQATKKTGTRPHTTSTHPQTVRLRTGDFQDLHPRQTIEYFQKQIMPIKCLQRDNKDYLLTLEHLHHKTTLLAKDKIITVDKHNILIEDPDRKVTFVNIFGAPYELADEVIVEHLQVFGQIVNKRRGHYMTHPEVENGICRWRMLLNRPTLSVVRVGPVRLTVKYKGQPGSCYKCGSFGHPPARCQNLVCHYCGEMGHKVAVSSQA